ncbi:hypothetical protein H9L39_17459 [Fusarium oxysporum f. sp. albedinis]|nr:hypothetical protein H9L39_17459 [Fusarium oxysporum f. sp. albedinis]
MDSLNIPGPRALLHAGAVVLAFLPASWAITLPERLTGEPCVSVNGAWQITEDCVDPKYSQPVIDSETDETSPVPHRKVSGHFEGTTIDFNVYLPKEGFKGRFFQILYPLQTSTSLPQEIGFGAESGGYTVRAKGFPSYRGDAAAAKKIHGYCYGGSGGSLLTVGAMENTIDVWSGAVTLIMATPVSTPNNWSIRSLAGLVLEKKADKLQDAVSPGGSGNPNKSLNDVEQAALEEATALGTPLKTWEDLEAVGAGEGLWEFVRGTGGNAVKSDDPTYFEDFWTKPGYLGTEKSKLAKLLQKEKVDYETTIKSIKRDGSGAPTELTLKKGFKTARAYWLDVTLLSKSGEAVGTVMVKGESNSNSKVVTFHVDADAAVTAQLQEGSKIRVDNKKFLAMHGVHRHQLPTREGFYGYDYLRDASGTPLYPQRSNLIAPKMSKSTSGGATHSGKFNGKMIVMDNLMDYDAFGWHADWYKNTVLAANGDKANDKFRLNFSENADHYMGEVLTSKSARLLDFTGLYEQHLRDLSAWCEKGTAPITPTKYTVNNAQIQLPARAAERKGIQPVIDMSISGYGAKRADVRKGTTVNFKIRVEVPPGAGKVVSVEWDFEGNGNYVKKDFGRVRSKVETSVSYTYSKSGTYFPSVRVSSHREGKVHTPYALAANLGRGRVVVK